jgi:O-antigen/teichoic acid export membrane protein
VSAGPIQLEPLTEATPEMSGLQAGAIVFIAVGASNVCSYLFHLFAARSLGPSSYGDVATLAGLIGIIILPLSGAQVFVARHVATSRAQGRAMNKDDYVSGFGGALLLAGGVLTLILLLASPAIETWLSIGSLLAVVLAILVTLPSFLTPVMVGAAQGRHLFMLVGIATFVPAALRVVFTAGTLEAGFGVSGTMAATLLATLIAVAIPLIALRKGLAGSWRPRLPRRDAIALLPVLAGTLAITLLTTDDLVAAKVSFTPHEAGIYGSASLIGRVILYLPIAIVTVLLPKVSASVSAGKSTRSLLTNSLLATGAVCVAFTIMYIAFPHLIVRIAFGAQYQGASSLLWMFAIAMSLYSLLNVVLVYRLGHHETRTAWLLMVGAVVQALLFLLFNSSPQELLWVSIAVGAVLLATAIAFSARPTRAAATSMA